MLNVCLSIEPNVSIHGNNNEILIDSNRSIKDVKTIQQYRVHIICVVVQLQISSRLIAAVDFFLDRCRWFLKKSLTWVNVNSFFSARASFSTSFGYLFLVKNSSKDIRAETLSLWTISSPSQIVSGNGNRFLMRHFSIAPKFLLRSSSASL